jgi:hypothetical protein
MKQLFSRSLAHVSQRRLRVTWLIVLPLAMGLLFAFTPVASPAAFAATNGQTRANLAAPHFALAPGSAQGSGLVTLTTVESSQVGSGVHLCKTFTSYLNFGYLGVQNEMYLKMVTSWCYNNSTVTSHSTVLYWGTTAAGDGSGWIWQYSPNYSFNCLSDVQGAINRTCAGNHERAEERFINPFLKGEASLTIDQYEAYNGQEWNLFNAHYCPGGC